MKIISAILLPFSWIYGFVVSIRRSFFEWGLFKRKTSEIPSVVIGNISAGGTGKTPFVMWLAKALRQKHPAVLSRGYKRKSKGFYEVNLQENVQKFGDEPVEIFSHFKGEIPVYVCENRVLGISQIIKSDSKIKLAILDDGFQHLQLKANFYVLLCNYERPFFKDEPFPSGHLREFAFNARYADAIVVTKCPANLDMTEGLKWYDAMAGYGNPIFFANYQNHMPADHEGNILKSGSKVISVSALANNQAFLNWAEKDFLIAESFNYVDHYPFKNSDISSWESAAEKHNAVGILMSRKDAMRLGEKQLKTPVFITYTEVNFLFDGEDDLIALISGKING